MTYELHLRDARKAGREEGKAEGLVEGEARGEVKGRMQNLLENIRSLMQSLPCEASKAMDLLNVPAADRKAILAQL